MAKLKMYSCDVCGEYRHYEEIMRLKNESGSFVNFFNQHKRHSDRKVLDVCTSCADKFGEWRKSQKKDDDKK